ncbi:MAG: DUF551 domain-containing protein [Paludibacter sp.]|nr:DUF551 domain-containing protein [Paludibacter sp.]
MKTIEQAINEFCKNVGRTGYGKTCYSQGFKAGVEFAQQWISVKDELPKEYKRVIVKNQAGEWLVAFWNSEEWCLPYTSFIQDFPFEVTHWRPINIE